MKEKFLKKYDAIFNAYQTGNATYSSIEDPIKSQRTKDEATANFEKITDFFKKIVNALPEDQKTALHSAFEEKFKAQLGNRYESYLKTLIPPTFPTPESKQYHLFHSIQKVLITNGSAREIVEKAVEFIDDNKLEEMMNEIDAFQSDIIDNVKVEFFRKRVEELKKINEERIKDENELKALNDELENVAKTVITSTSRYSNSQGDVYDGIYRHIAEDRLDELNEKMLTKPEYQHFRDYFEVDSTGKYRGTRSISKKHLEDTKMADAFTGDNVKLIFSEKTKASILKVFEYMREHKMLRNDRTMGEQGGKLYGFAAIYEAHEKIRDAIEGTDVEKIRESRELYERELENMRGLYALIQEEFQPVPEMMVGNINSYRLGTVPNEFKNNLLLNALVSGFFNVNAALAQQNFTVEMLLENPNKVFLQVVKGFSETVTASAEVKGKNIAQAIKTLTIATPNKDFPAYGLGRNMEFLQAITYGSDSFEKNSLGTMFFSSYASYVGNIVFDCDGNSLTAMDYLRINPVETLANILLVNDEDRDYNKLRAVDTLSVDCTEKIPAFDTMKYLETHTVDAGALIDRIKSTVAELYDQEYFQRDEKATRYDAIAYTIRAAQFAAYQFLMVHPNPNECDPDITDKRERKRITAENKQKWAELKKIVMNPERVFKNQIDEKTKEALNKRLPKHKMFDEEAKAKIDAARIKERNAAQEFLNNTAELRKKFAELSVQFGTGIGDEADKVRAEYTSVKNDINFLEGKELKRLKDAYEEGYVPTSYYEQRRRDIKNGNLDNFIPFGVDESFAIARTDAREAENAYEKNTEFIRTQIDKLSKELDNGNQNVKAEYDAAVAELNVLKEAELKRLDKAYTDGKLTQSYYEERRYNIETNNLKNTVPFGLDEAPSFNEFKARYKNDLDLKELGTDEVKMFYERMMERMRIDDFKFKEIVSGGYPKPTIVAEEVATEPERENIVVEGVMENNVGALSERVDKTLPELTNSKDKEQLKV